MRIVCIHQGYELYGSDRCFIESVAALREAWPQADIEVVLPQDGPIVTLLRAHASRIVFEPLFVLRRSELARLIFTAPFRLIPALWRAMQRMRSADLVYVNTVVVLDYLIMARFFREKVLAHVHEIPDGLKLKIFRAVLLWADTETIFNSKATRAAYRFPPGRTSHVVYNGITTPADHGDSSYDGMRPLRVLMLGRINRIKGQDLLIEALASLPDDIARRLEVRIVGDTFGEDREREEALRAAVIVARLDSIVRFEPFQNDPSPLYRWADIVVVPSRLPEALGRVAIEAMAYRRPPLVARIGGLSEVIEDGLTGWTVPPNDAQALADKLTQIVTEPARWRMFGVLGRERFAALFAAPTIARQFQAIVRARFAPRGGKPVPRGLASAR